MSVTITTETIESLVSVRAELKALKAREEALRAELVAVMGDQRSVTIGDFQVSLVEAERPVANLKELAEAFPEAYEAVVRLSVYDRLTIK
jgi:predicted phage-related endonuclease